MMKAGLAERFKNASRIPRLAQVNKPKGFNIDFTVSETGSNPGKRKESNSRLSLGTISTSDNSYVPA
jgi:hypothetical protein